VTLLKGMRVTVKATIYNSDDEALVRANVKKPEEVRQVSLDCVADSGATMLTLPEEIVALLGLTPLRKVKVRYASGKIEEKWIKGGARVEIQGRTAITQVLVENQGTTPLLGHVVMELMDLLIDPAEGKVKPRPESPELPLIEQFLTRF